MSATKFKGTGVAIITPFRKDSTIDFGALENLVNFLISNKVNYLVVLGTTGESVTLSKDEKNAVISFVTEINNNRVPVIAGIGGNNTQDIINNIKETDFDNIDGILSVAPYYNKPTQKGLYQHFKTIAGACPVPVIIYNVPGRTGVNISADTTLKLASEIKNIVAVKEASGNIEQMTYIIKDKPEDFLVISGDDSLTLPLISIGGAGVISVLANAFPCQVSELVNNALEGNYEKASLLHLGMAELISLLFIEGNPAGIKAVMSAMDLVQNNLRLPLTPVSRNTYNRITEVVKGIST